MQLWRSLLHLVLLLVDEGVVADRLAHLQVLGLALVVLAGQVLVHVAHLGERLFADRTRIPWGKVFSSMHCTTIVSFACIPSEPAHIVVVLLVHVLLAAV